GERLRIIRKYFGETQVVFADRFGLQRHDIANYERGRTDLPSSMMGGLDRLGFNISWLVTGDGDMHKVEELLNRFKQLSEEFDRLSTQYRTAREELLRVLAVAEPNRSRFTQQENDPDLLGEPQSLEQTQLESIPKSSGLNEVD
ncbi:MAG: helix-turn-helix transcriptional regulator, partial [Candidatus Neomarinimicrobiota bacterium]